MHRIFNRVVTIIGTPVAIVTLGLMPAIGPAQEQSFTERPDSAEALEEIIVTARKREERLQDVPISITAFDATAMRDRNILDPYQLMQFTPNVSFAPNLGRRLDQPNIRGQFGPLIGGTAPNASFFVDGVYVSGTNTNSIATTSLANLERVEILRGPQSALFGRATFSGAINYITRKPTDVWEGEVQARAGEDEQVELNLWGSGPLIKDHLYVYAGLGYNKWGGQWRNGLEAYCNAAAVPGDPDYTPGCTGDELAVDTTALAAPFSPFIWRNNIGEPGDPACPPGSQPANDPSLGGAIGCGYTIGDNTKLGGQETKLATIKLNWRATEALEFNFKYEKVRSDDDHFAYLFVPPLDNNNCYNRDENGVDQDPNNPTGVRSGGWYCGELQDQGFVPVNNLVDFRRGTRAGGPGVGPGGGAAAPSPVIGLKDDIDRFLVEGIFDVADYQFTLRYAHNEIDAEYARDLDRSYAKGPASVGLFESYEIDDVEDDSVEFKVMSPGDRVVRWTFGLYYYDLEASGMQQDFSGFARNTLTDTGRNGVTNQAVFGSVEFDLNESWRVTVDGRYAEDEVDNESGVDPATGMRTGAEETFTSFSPRVSLNWFVNDDVTTYVQVAQGNKPGGFNFAYFDVDVHPDELLSDKPFIEEEDAWTYEIGMKGSFFGRRLSTNIAVFYIDWTNQAINVQECIRTASGVPFCENNNIVTNAGASTVYGGEIEATWNATDNLLFNLAYGYTDSTVDEYLDDEFAVIQCPDLCFQTVDGTVDTPLTPAAEAARNDLANVAGNSAPRVPRNNMALSGLYQAPIRGETEWFLRSDLLYESKKYTTTSNLTYSPELWIWNARIGLEGARWQAAFYVDNITNEKSALAIQDFPLFDGSKGYLDLGDPANNVPGAGAVAQNSFQILPRRTRNYGVTMTYRFGG